VTMVWYVDYLRRDNKKAGRMGVASPTMTTDALCREWFVGTFGHRCEFVSATPAPDEPDPVPFKDRRKPVDPDLYMHGTVADLRRDLISTLKKL
jgi:hypothetical protein